MSTAQFAVPGILAPLQGLWRWLMPATEVRHIKPIRTEMEGREFATYSVAKNTRMTRADVRKSIQPTGSRPLRIVRVMESGQAPAFVGRMVISGRMADVCAELDRLAAREAALH